MATEEAKRYISGRISFMKDDPGRQTIGSFNPITDDDWTEMAYVNDTEMLCHAIVNGDLGQVQRWLEKDGTDPNRRDYTGRTPLQLAIISSTPEVVQCLVDHGARLVARMADGRTALHLAAAHGKLEMVRILLFRSEANEAEEDGKAEARRKARANLKETEDEHMTGLSGPEASDSQDSDNNSEHDEEEASDEDYEMTDGEEDVRSRTTGSFVKIDKKDNDGAALPQDETEDEPDFYDVNVLAWDSPTSALHLAIINGHVDVVQELVQTFGADVLLPVKVTGWNNEPSGAILTLVLALAQPVQKAKLMASTLLKLGATAAQANMDRQTALQYYIDDSADLLQILVDNDLPAVQRVINHVSMSGSRWYPSGETPIITAIKAQDSLAVKTLLELGAHSAVTLSDWTKSFTAAFDKRSIGSANDIEKTFNEKMEQPLYVAITNEKLDIAMDLLNHGADPNTLTLNGQSVLQNEYQRRWTKGSTVLDLVREKLEAGQKEKKKLSSDETKSVNCFPWGKPQDPFTLGPDENYLSKYEVGSYRYWYTKMILTGKREDYRVELEHYNRHANEKVDKTGCVEKLESIDRLIQDLKALEEDLIQRGAKSFDELHPDIRCENNNHQNVFHSQPFKTAPFEVSFQFSTSNPTPELKEAYLEVFEAAWRGDLETIKSYTLAPWGPKHDQEPLRIAVTNTEGSTPFSLAVMKGHLDTAKGILAIAQAQYSPNDSDANKRYEINNDSDDEDTYDSEADSDDENVRIHSQLVDDNFTIDNIGVVATQVKSTVKPHEFMTWGMKMYQYVDTPTKSAIGSTYAKNLTALKELIKQTDPRDKNGIITWEVQSNNLFDVAVMNDDLEMLVWLLELYQDYAKIILGEDLQPRDIATIREQTFKYAIKLGRTRHLSELIRRTGAGIPLDELVKKSGIEIKQKPRSYQGLSVYGKKRADWADAARGHHEYVSSNQNQLPPLLQAALDGSIESVEYFLSDTPKRCYSEFARENKDWPPVQILGKTAGGFDAAVSKFLDKNSQSDTRLL